MEQDSLVIVVRHGVRLGPPHADCHTDEFALQLWVVVKFFKILIDPVLEFGEQF